MKKILGLAFLLRLPSLFEPYWYGDEGIYQVIGQAVRGGRLLYGEIWDNKPPLLYVIYALFDGDQFLVRLASLVVMLTAIIGFYYLTKELFANSRTAYITTFLFAVLFALPLLEGNIANAENFMLFPIIVALYLALRGQSLLPGFLLGIAFLIKSVAIFDLAALLAFLFVADFLKDTKRWFRKSLLLVLGFIIPIAATVFFFAVKGVLSDFFVATFSQNVTYVGAGNTFLVGQGLLIMKLLILFIVCLTLFILRKRMAKEYLFIYLWLAFSLFNAMFGGRPWTHYLLTLLPAFCLFLGILISDARLRFINLAVLIIFVLLLYKNFWIYGKTVSYYSNFIAYATGQKDETAYRSFFDWFVNRDYDIANYIREHTEESDTIFIWGDNAQIYALSRRLPVGRYSVSYHVTFYPHALSETNEAIAKKEPRLIIAIRDDFPNELLSNAYTFSQEIGGAKIYARRT